MTFWFQVSVGNARITVMFHPAALMHDTVPLRRQGQVMT